MWSIDGNIWDVPCTIERVAEVTPSEVSGMLLNKQYFNDVIGTFMKYTIAIAVPVGMESDYKYIYEVLTDPVEAHSFVFPYNDATIQITGRVENVSDKYYPGPNDSNGWRGTKFTVIANHPSKELSLSEAIQRGLTPLPLVQHANNGDVYVYDDGWQDAEVEDGKYYLYDDCAFEELDMENADNKEY